MKSFKEFSESQEVYKLYIKDVGSSNNHVFIGEFKTFVDAENKGLELIAPRPLKPAVAYYIDTIINGRKTKRTLSK